jgi:4-hydroxy-2-oxoglutarate aldolase
VHKEIVARFGAPGIKAALELVGLHGGPPRAPLAPVGEKTRRHLARVMQEAELEGVRHEP